MSADNSFPYSGAVVLVLLGVAFSLFYSIDPRLAAGWLCWQFARYINKNET